MVNVCAHGKSRCYKHLSAFTLIELMTVMAIILVLAGMLLASITSLRDNADDTVTKQRMKDVLVGLRSRLGDETGVDRLQNAFLRRELKWDSLRGIVSALINYDDKSDKAVQLTDYEDIHVFDPIPSASEVQADPAKFKSAALLPPGLFSIHDGYIGNVKPRSKTAGTGLWIPLRDHLTEGASLYGASIDRELIFGYWDNTIADIPYWGYNEVIADKPNGLASGLPNGRSYSPLESTHSDIDSFWATVPARWPSWYKAAMGWRKVSGGYKHDNYDDFSVGRDEDRATNVWCYGGLGILVDDSYAFLRHETATKTEPLQFSLYFDRNSRLGETLDFTIDVLPEKPESSQWYIEQWPILVEYEAAGEGENVGKDIVVQRAWPDSNWDQADPAINADGDPEYLPPIWEMPFGTRVLSQREGGFIDQFHRRTTDDIGRRLNELSPLTTIELLVLSGIVPDAQQYRNDRNVKRPWNDAWGNPLVVGAAMTIPPRHGPDPEFKDNVGKFGLNYARDYGMIDSKDKPFPYMFISGLQGPRDWLWRRLEETTGGSRRVYISVGAVGSDRQVVDHPSGDPDKDNLILTGNGAVDGFPDWDADGELTWEPAQDDLVLRALWLQVLEHGDAADWNEEAFEAPPWYDIRKQDVPGDSDGNVFISSPEVFP